MDRPQDTEEPYLSNELIHRLAGFILAVTNGGTLRDAEIELVVHAARTRGPYYLDQLTKWVADQA